jgi:hypothetical protein
MAEYIKAITSDHDLIALAKHTADAPIVASAPSKPTSPLHALTIKRSKSGAMQLL